MHSGVSITFAEWMKKKHNMKVKDADWFKLATDYFQQYKREVYDKEETHNANGRKKKI